MTKLLHCHYGTQVIKFRIILQVDLGEGVMVLPMTIREDLLKGDSSLKGFGSSEDPTIVGLHLMHLQ